MFKVIAAGLIGFGTAIVVIGCALTNEKLRKDFIDEISKKDNKIDDIKDDIIDVAEAAEELPEEIVEAAEEVVDKVTTEFSDSCDRIKESILDKLAN
jgi:uncharacterized protein YoxC